jgi:RimJ/RimL family protein N-acetyltransferase
MGAVLADPARHLLLAADDGGDIGTLRWDCVNQGEFEVSLTIAPERRGRSLASSMLRSGEDWLAMHEPATHTLLASVHIDNTASLRLFESAGYLPDLPPGDDGFLRLVKQRVPTA